MRQEDNNHPDSVVGPLGERLSYENLPPERTSRWVVRRKAQVVAAVNGGLLTMAEACTRYDLTMEELASWQRAFELEGMMGLRLDRVQPLRAKQVVRTRPQSSRRAGPSAGETPPRPE